MAEKRFAFHGEIHIAKELVLDFVKNGLHGYIVKGGVPADAILADFVIDPETGTLVMGFDTAEEVSALVIPTSESVDVAALQHERDMLTEAVETFGLQTPKIPPAPYKRPEAPAHGTLNPTNGRTGVTTKVAV